MLDAALCYISLSLSLWCSFVFLLLIGFMKTNITLLFNAAQLSKIPASDIRSLLASLTQSQNFSLQSPCWTLKNPKWMRHDAVCRWDHSHALITKVPQPCTYFSKVASWHLFFWTCLKGFWEMKENASRNISWWGWQVDLFRFKSAWMH